MYINKCKAFIDFMISQQQWSGLTIADVTSWLNNFKGLSVEEQELVYKLLTNIIYFSENDMADALRQGVYYCLSYWDVLETQKASCFTTSLHSLNSLHNTNIRKAYFVPLSDKGAPHESGNNISRILVQQGIIPPERSVFIEQVPDLLKSETANNLVIVDDCVGTGNQLKAFLEETKLVVGDRVFSIKEFCHENGLKANYLTLFGYDKSITELRNIFPELSIICVRELNDQHRVFSDTSYIWKDQEERDKALCLFESLTKNIGISVYGYKELDFAFIMHKTIPNWSLPIFWKENSDWNLLMRRKSSND